MDALFLLLDVGGNLGKFTGNFTFAHYVTASMLVYILVLPHLLRICCCEITILGFRIVCISYVSAGIDFSICWEAMPPVIPTSSAPTTFSASAASSPTVTTSDTTTGVNVRDLEITTAITSLADKKLVVKMASRTGEIVMQSYVLDLGNAMVMIFSLDPLQEKYYFILDSPVIVPMGSQHGINGMLLHM